MLYRNICNLLGSFFCVFSLAFLFPIAVAIYYQFYLAPELHPQPHTTDAFLGSFGICLVFGILLKVIGRNSSGQLYLREGLATVVLIWTLTPAISALPFYLSGTLENPYQAYFEAVSGFTTTGSSMMEAKRYDAMGNELPIVNTVSGVLDTTYSYYGTIKPVRDPQTGKELYTGVEAVSKALLWWRSFIQWLGGVGIVVLFVAVLPAMGVGGKILLFTEMPGPLKDGLTPRIQETAAILWKIYIGLTVLQIAAMMLTNEEIGLFDATTTTFATLATGGFSVRNASIGAYNSPITDWVVIAFMLAGGLNFSLYFHAIRGKIYRLYEPELLIYLAIVVVSCGFAAYYLYGTSITLLTGETLQNLNVEQAIRYSAFQLISGQTTTGFATADPDNWPYVVQIVMIILMFIGGMSGSTSGGLKVVRPYMLFRILQTRVESMFRPEAVRTFRIGNREVDTGVALTVLCFFLVVTFVAVLGTFLFALTGVDLETSVGLVACMMNNTGLVFRAASPAHSCAFLTDAGTNISSAWMILGRLEYFAILVMLVPAFWKQNR